MLEIWASWQTKVSDLFVTHCLSLIAGIEHKFMTMFKQAVIGKHGVQMQFVKVFLGFSGWGVTVYKLYAVYILVWGSCMTCCTVCVPSSE